MAAFSTVIDFVSSTISRCIQCIGSEDLSDLDMILLSLSSSSAQIGALLDEVLVTGERHIQDDALMDLRQLATPSLSEPAVHGVRNSGHARVPEVYINVYKMSYLTKLLIQRVLGEKAVC